MEKRTIVAIALIILVIIGYQAFIIPRFAPPPPPVAAPPKPSPTPAPEAAPPVAAVTSPVIAPEAPPLVLEAPLEKIAIDRPLYAATFSNSGGGLESWQLKSYKYGSAIKGEKGEKLEGTPLELVRPEKGAAPFALTFLDPATQAGFTAPMAVTKSGDTVTLQGADAKGLVVTRNYSFSKDNFIVDLVVTIENRGQAPRPVAWEMAWGPGIDRHVPEKARAEEAAVSFTAGKLDTVTVKKVGQSQDVGQVSWIGLGSRYFVAVLIPQEGGLAAFVRKTTAAGDEIGLRSSLASLAPAQSVSYRMQAYLGPKDRSRLAAAGHSLERSVDYGFFSWLALPFLAVLQFCYRFLHSYGLAIFALTLLVKGSLFPISLKMYRSMKKMQEMAPRLQALKAKFKGDNQGLQMATMALYKEHKVNPMAGCLPMLIQIPVFFALYKVLYNAIELRGAGFLYLKDLSQMDPYYVMPILMGATMLIQQRMSPTVGDPMQAKMMMFMPVIMTAMFINFSSGLVLYFLFSNLMSIGEQKLFRVLGAREKQAEVEVIATADAPGGGRKKRPSKKDR
jgi:YidC/Oxa1 family membrane protein insertase